MEPEFALLSQQIGSRLRAERQRRGWSLSDLSNRTNGRLSKSRISNYEQGIRRMGLEAAKLLAAALEDATPAWLLLLDETDPLSEAELALIDRFRDLEQEDQARLISMMQTMKKSERPAPLEGLRAPDHETPNHPGVARRD